MADALVRFLRFLSRACRILASIGAVFLAVRLAWLSGGDALGAVWADLRAGEGDEGQADADPDAKSAGDETSPPSVRPADSHRPNLDQLMAQHDAPTQAPLEPEARQTQAKVRRILVDLGPERSEVFVNGRSLGRVPFAGQVHCSDGDEIRIQVLPPEGIPLERKVSCRGAVILAR